HQQFRAVSDRREPGWRRRWFVKTSTFVGGVCAMLIALMYAVFAAGYFQHGAQVLYRLDVYLGMLDWLKVETPSGAYVIAAVTISCMIVQVYYFWVFAHATVRRFRGSATDSILIQDARPSPSLMNKIFIHVMALPPTVEFARRSVAAFAAIVLIAAVSA